MADAVAVHEGLFTTEPRLIGGNCAACGRHQFPRGPLCPYCGSDEVDEALLSPSGTLWMWTAVTAPPPGYRGDVPYGFGVVELPEGLRVITRLAESDPSALTFGQAVTLQLVRLHSDDDGNDVVTWAFG
ncbi:MAG: OB-fold domain-containing protein [Acidimicrobiia bacterium]|nr:OB-fold domain-containing protein [Acidimicrobiia bacterium]